MTPKVFMSHASEDKDRFVLEFATRLRGRGIDVWLDQWEMFPGDSLIDKIFDGINDAKMVIIVLSQFSVEKPWVKEELNAAFIKRINNGSKLIPVVIDNCEIPDALKTTVWECISDLTAYDSNFDRIVASIFGATDKPPIGSYPEYVNSFVSSIGGLNNIDSLVLSLSCETALESGSNSINQGNALLKDGKPIMPEQELKESLEMLGRDGYISLSNEKRRVGLPDYHITTNGFEAFANICIPEYQNKIKAVISMIVNNKLESNTTIYQRLNEPKILVNHILDVLENNGYLSLVKTFGGDNHILNVSPALKRSLFEA
jgi:TIR domain